jgi:hypothetical protein
MHRVRPCYQGITVSTEGEGRVPRSNSLTAGLTLRNNRGNEWFQKKQIPFQRSYWLISCVLGILQSHALHPRALYVSLITTCNVPYKYTKNSLQGCYGNGRYITQLIETRCGFLLLVQV